MLFVQEADVPSFPLECDGDKIPEELSSIHEGLSNGTLVVLFFFSLTKTRVRNCISFPNVYLGIKHWPIS